MAGINNRAAIPEMDDETVVKTRQAAQAKKSVSTRDDMIIDGCEHKFARREFPYGFSMIVPESFEDMPRDIAKQMFPYEDRPEIILSDSAYRVCLAFNKSERQSLSLEERLISFRGYIKRICPTSVFFSDGIYHLPERLDIAHYDYRYPAADSDLYDLTFFADFNDIELLGWFICPIEQKDQWEPRFREMIQTLKAEKKEN